MKRHRRAKYALCAFGIALCFLLTGMQAGAINWFVSDDTDTTDPDGSVTAEYTTMATNDALELQLTESTGQFRVCERATGHIWRSVQKGELTEEEANGFTYLQSNVESALLLTYFPKTASDASYQTIYSDECSSVTVSRVTAGADVTYVFDGIGVSITVQYRLADNTLSVSIPASGVQETGDYLLATVSVAPFFGSGRDTDDGFVLLPDGCGTLVNFKEDHPQYATYYEQSIYGSDTVRVDTDIYSSKEDVMLPVFGISNGGYGMTCDIRAGAEDTTLVCYPSGYQLELTSAYPSFQLRRAYYATLANTSTVRKYFTDPITQDYTAVYTFLGEGKDTYSDMAASYRQYLLKSGQLRPTLKTDSVLALDVFMAAQESKMMANEYITVTTFAQAEDMLSQLLEQNADSLLVQMTGWTKGGYAAAPNRFPIPGKLGGASGSEAFNRFAEEAGLTVYFADDYLSADSTLGSVNLDTVVYQGNGLITETDATGTKYLFSPQHILKNFLKTNAKYEKAGIQGLLFERLGQELYFDFNPEYEDATRADTAKVWQELLKTWSEQGNRTAAQGGNAYVLPYTDWVRDIPSRDSGYFFRDETVPFYQLVVHGSVLYTGTSVNLFSDSEADYLKMIEYGYVPLFILSHDSPDKLVSSNYNQLFSSEFAQYKERILEEYAIFSSDFAGLNQQPMVGHRKVAEDVYCTTYEDGTEVYVNYSDTAYTEGDVTVPAEDYTVKRR